MCVGLYASMEQFYHGGYKKEVIVSQIIKFREEKSMIIIFELHSVIWHQAMPFTDDSGRLGHVEYDMYRGC